MKTSSVSAPASASSASARGLLRPALGLLLGFTLLCGGLYPLAVTAAAQLLFADEANGSLLRQHGERGARGEVLGSSLIGQPFADARYFWGRPSATGPTAYNAAASTGSNLGPTNPALAEAIAARLAALRAADPQASVPVPVDLVTASASGLDPHLSPAAALYQVRRVAAARGLDAEQLRRLVEAHVEGRTWGLLGEPRVNVLRLNLAVDGLR